MFDLTVIRFLIVAIFACVGPCYAQSVEDDYRLAAGFFSRGQWSEAHQAFETLMQRYPATEQATSASFYLGESLMQLDRFGDAYQAYQVYLKRRPTGKFSPRATFRMGESAYRSGNRDTALRMLEIFVRSNPDHQLNEFALAYLGEIRLKRFEPQLAQRAYETCLRLFPSSSLSSQCRFGLAKALQLQGMNEDAERFFLFICERSQQQSIVAQAHLQLGIMAFSKTDFENAEKHLSKAMEEISGDHRKAEAAYWLARTRIKFEDHENAFKLLRSISLADVPPELATSIYYDGAVAAIKVGKSGLADNWLNRLRKKYPQHVLADDALHMQIGLSQQAADEDRTVSLAQTMVTQFPDSPWRMNAAELLGRIHYGRQKYEESAKIFRGMQSEIQQQNNADNDEQFAKVSYLLALNQFELGDLPAASLTLDAVEGLSQNTELQSLIQIAIASIQFAQNKFEDSIPHYRTYLLLSPKGTESLRARTDLTVALAETGRWQAAKQAFENLRIIHSKESIVSETAAYLADKAAKSGNPELASDWHHFLIDSNDMDRLARSLHELAWIEMEKGNTGRAMEYFAQLLADCPDSEFALKAAMARAKFLVEKNDFTQSSQLYGFVIRRFNGTELANIARLRRAHVMQQIGDQTSLFEAKALLEEYIALPPDQPHHDEALYRMAWVHIDLGLIEDAHDYFRKLMMDFPKSKYWGDASYRLAKYELSQQRLDIAKTILNLLDGNSQIPPEVLSRALFLKGQIASNEKDWPTVRDTMQKLIDTGDDNRLVVKGMYWYAESLYRLDNLSDAINVYEKLKDHSQLGASLRPWVCLRHAQSLGRLHRWEEALEIAQLGLETFPAFSADYEFEYVKGRGLEDAGLLTDARVSYANVVDSKSGGSTETAAMAQWRIGETYFHQEDYKSAIEAYYKVDSLFSFPDWRSAALLQAGKCQEHLGNWRHALKLYTKLIETFPESEYAKTAKERMERVSLFARMQQETENRY